MIKYVLSSLALVLAACGGPNAQSPDLPETSTLADTDLPAQKDLTLERLFETPSLSGRTPQGVKYSPDGKRVTFLKARESDGSRYDLWQFEVETGEQSMLVDSKILEPEDVELSEAEKALRERKRIAGRKGIVSYDWGTADTILVPLGGNLHLVSLGEEISSRQLTDTDAFEYDAKVSPGGRFVSFIRDGAVWSIDLETNEETRLTPEAEPNNAIQYGVAEFVAQEEMSRYTGYWWSPDDRYLAYTRVDESTVDIIPRFDIAAEDVTVIEQRYPRAGRPNAIVDLFVRDMETGEVRQLDIQRMDWGEKTDQYLARVNWLSPTLLRLQRVGRDQNELCHSVLSLDVERNVPVLRECEKQPSWINLSDDFTPTGDGYYIYSTEDSWSEEVSSEGEIWRGPTPGFRQLVATNDEGQLLLTQGDWPVDEVEGLDRKEQVVFFTGYKDTPLERHLYSAPYNDPEDVFQMPEPTRITELGKSWSITMAPDGKSFVGTSSSPTQPPQTGLYKSDGTLITWIEENALDENHPYAPYLNDHTVPEYGTLKAEDGSDLYYSIQTPPDFDPAKKYPVILYVYGGPGAQVVTRNWESLTDQYYTRQGYIVWRLDNRGTPNRGKAFEDVIYRQMGIPEVRDQLVGVEHLKSLPYVDAGRIAIHGWSYGGYMTLMTILQAPENTFAAAFAGAPVTDWALYDTFYTERYMDTPQDNPDGYEKSSVFYHLDKLEHELPPLMLVHGMADDNVTFDNTTRLMAELQKRGILFELMTYPGQRHGIRGAKLSTHLMKTRMAFFERHLKND